MDAGRPSSPQMLGRPEMGLGPAWMKPAKRPLLTPGGRPLGGRRRRVVAYIADVIVVTIGMILLRVVAELVVGHQLSAVEDLVSALLLAVVNGAVLATYQVSLWSGGRSTVGMRLLGITVVSASDEGPIGIGAAARRWVVLEGIGVALGILGLIAFAGGFGTVETVSSLLTLGWLIALLASTTADERRQGLHDKVARTYVVRR